jgi:hypothetical protein
VTTAQLNGCSSTPLLGGGGVALCCVRLYGVCSLRRVVYDCFFFFNDMTTLLYLKKNHLGGEVTGAIKRH